MPTDLVAFVFLDLYLGNEINLDKHGGFFFYLAEIRQWHFNIFKRERDNLVLIGGCIY